MRRMLKSKIHRATVTQADLDYEGSVTIDARLLSAADILPYEEVHCWNVTQGTRFTTYAINGEAGSGTVCVNGAAAHLVTPGDLMIIAAFASIDDQAARDHRPTVVFVDEQNAVREISEEVPGPARRLGMRATGGTATESGR